MNKTIFSTNRFLLIAILTVSIIIGVSCTNFNFRKDKNNKTPNTLSVLRSMGSVPTAQFSGDVVLYTYSLVEPKEKSELRVKTEGKVNSLLSKVNLKKKTANEESAEDAQENEQSEKRNELVYVTNGAMAAGFDLSKLSDDALNVSESGVTLILPEPEILEFNVGASTPFYKKGSWSKEDEESFKNEFESLYKEQIVDGGILEEAKEKGIQKMTTILKAMGYDNIIIKIKSN